MTCNESQDYLRNIQYKNAGNLEARIQIHQRFKTNPYDWFRWVFDHFHTTKPVKVIELGCGQGNLWSRNTDRLPGTWEITLTDLSPGMLAEAEKNLVGAPVKFLFKIVDAQTIPYPNETFDIVVANHMLYHVVDRKQALAEISRVLKPGGTFYAATNGSEHMGEIYSLGEKLIPSLREQATSNFGLNLFTLENGAAQLQPFFASVKVDYYPDSLEITESDPLVDYILSIVDLNTLSISQSQIEEFKQTIQDQIDKSSSILVKKNTVLFMGEK